MFPVGELFFPNWKPCFWGLLTFYIIFCHFPRSRPLKQGKKKVKRFDNISDGMMLPYQPVSQIRQMEVN
jgi:hypothetical protein